MVFTKNNQNIIGKNIGENKKKNDEVTKCRYKSRSNGIYLLGEKVRTLKTDTKPEF